MSVLKMKLPTPTPDRPSFDLRDHDEEYRALVHRRAELDKRRAEIENELLPPLHARLRRAQDHNVTPLIPREQRSSAVRRLLGDLLRDEPDEPEQPQSVEASTRQQIATLEEEHGDVLRAIAVLDDRIRPAKKRASAALCSAIRPEWDDVLQECANAARVFAQAYSRYTALTNDLTRSGADWPQRLGPVTLNSVDDPRRKQSGLSSYLRTMCRRGLLDAKTLPPHWRPE